MVPWAPALLSTMTACPIDSDSALATIRVTLSVTEPAGNGATKVIGLMGKFCACACIDHNIEAVQAMLQIKCLSIDKSRKLMFLIQIQLEGTAWLNVRQIKLSERFFTKKSALYI